MTRNVIDVTDRLTPGARVLVRQRTAEMVKAANARRVRYNNVAAFFDGARTGHLTARLLRPTPPVTTYVDAWAGNPDTDKAWAHDILTGGR